MAKSRILFKADKTDNWDSNFQPLKGELCFYTDYIDTGRTNHNGNKIYRPQLKIGDGSSSLSQLAFFGNDYITNAQIEALFNGSSNSLDTATLDSLILG